MRDPGLIAGVFRFRAQFERPLIFEDAVFAHAGVAVLSMVRYHPRISNKACMRV
jgi:hypothetical protein